MGLHVVVPTHTTRHLHACVSSLLRQTRRPDHIVVSTDTDDPALGQALAAFSDAPCPILHVARARQSGPRLNQVRNNALRALDAIATDDDLVLVVDGDTMLECTAIEDHASSKADVVIPYRVMLDEATTSALAPGLFEVPVGRPDPWRETLMSEADASALRGRTSRYRRHVMLRRMRLGKRHKPKILGGHHAIRWRCLVAVNGYDERYVSWGWDDDDMALRLHMLGVRVEIAVDRIMAFQLWHPSRSPGSPIDAQHYAMFREPRRSPEAIRGLRHPLEQDDPNVSIISPIS
ncbi:MAG: glycosyltransferase [Phycisphaerales bacterium]|nr:glycosyltransferase [Phycisphaerales bacterium]